MDKNTLDHLLIQVINTFKFHGITIKSFDIEENHNCIVEVEISKSHRYEPLTQVLDLAYWAMIKLLNGSSEQSGNSVQLSLLYSEVE